MTTIGDKNKTKEKYMNALLYACNQREFSSTDFKQAFKINHNVLTAMIELGIIYKFKPGQYRWQLWRAPLATDVEAIRKRITAYNTLKEKPSLQPIIEPIKKFEQTQPAPLREEPICDNSNSKILLIMAVGAAIGFMIATIIWK
jgi:hypothetical protein